MLLILAVTPAKPPSTLPKPPAIGPTHKEPQVEYLLQTGIIDRSRERCFLRGRVVRIK